MTRSYRQSVRAEQANATAQRILDATDELFTTRDFEALTLQAVAERAGVTLQTVLRRFESKEKLFNAAAARKRSEIARARIVTTPGDIDVAVRTLVANYEALGEITWRMLRDEHRFPEMAQLLADARALHRAWIEATFESHLPKRGRTRERRILQLFGALDFYQWKLLRRDLHLSQKAAEELIAATVRAIVAHGGAR